MSHAVCIDKIKIFDDEEFSASGRVCVCSARHNKFVREWINDQTFYSYLFKR